jgi:hypothetical protein
MGICTAGPKAFFGSKAEIRVHSPDVSLKPDFVAKPVGVPAEG